MYFFAVLFVAITLLILGSRWHVSTNDHADNLKEFSVFALINLNDSDLPYVKNLPRVIIKDKLGAIDAVINAFALFVTTLSFLPLIIVLAIISVCMSIYGIATGDWNNFFSGLSMIFGLCLLFIVVVIGPFIWWIIMFIQPCTPGYFITWLFLGLPFIFLGWGSNALVFHGATVIIYPKG